MPGPKSNHQSTGERPDPNGDKRKPNRKAAARLKARRDAIKEMKRPPEHGFDMHMPGSQNRNK